MKALSQKKIKEHNLKLIFRTVADAPNVTRVQLANKTHLTKTTVSSLVEELLGRGFVTENEFNGNIARPGRKPVSALVLDSSRNYILSTVWEQHEMIFNLIALDSTVLYSYKVDVSDYSEVVKLIDNAYTNILRPAAEKLNATLLAVVMVFPGVVNKEEGSLHSTILNVVEDRKLPAQLKVLFPGFPIAFFNDTSCLGYAETKFTKLGKRDFAYINLNEGVGAALFTKGNMQQGAGAVSCQFGHVSLDRNGPECSCGNHGCVDILLGEVGLYRRGLESGFSGKESPCNFEQLHSYLECHHDSARILEKALADDLAYALGILISLNYPKVIIIGGKGAVLGEPFLEKVRAKVKKNSFKQFSDHVEIYYSKLSKDALAQGAARYFMDEHFKFLTSMDNTLVLG